MRKRSGPTKIATISMSLVVSILLLAGFVGIQVGHAASTPVNLGTAAPFAVLAYSGITNTGTTTITGNVGSYPTPSETGFGTVTITGTNYPAGAPGSTQTDLAAAMVQAGGYSPKTILTALDGQSLVAGVYTSATGTFLLSGGDLLLNGQGKTSSIWIFQAPKAIAGALSTTGGRVILQNGANSCNIFWVTSAGGATIGTSTNFKGIIMAYSSVTLATGATLQGAALAHTGDVTMDTNTISSSCVTTPPITTTSSTTTATTSSTTTATTSTTSTTTSTTTSPSTTTTSTTITPTTSTTTSPSTTTTTTTSATTCVFTSGTSSLTVNSIATNGSAIHGFEADVYDCHGNNVTFGFTPVSFAFNNNQQYIVGVDQNFRSCSFAYWLATGSSLPGMLVAINSNTSLTAVYNCGSAPSGSSVFVKILDQSGNPLVGYYVRLFASNGLESNDAYSPATFLLTNGATYSVEANNFSSCVFNHWQDTSSTHDTRTFTASGGSQTFVAIYHCALAVTTTSSSSSSTHTSSSTSTSTSSSTSHATSSSSTTSSSSRTIIPPTTSSSSTAASGSSDSTLLYAGLGVVIIAVVAAIAAIALRRR